MSAPSTPAIQLSRSADHRTMSAARSRVSTSETSAVTTVPPETFFGPFESLTSTGYPRLADLMGRHGEIAIFRKFGALNILNLMSLQAELLELEDELKDILLANEKPPNQILLRDFFEVRNNAAGEEQREKMKIIREKLREYNATLLGVSKVASLSPPHKANLHFLHRWLKGSKPGEGDSFLRGVERDTWHDKMNIDDFVTVDNHGEEKDAATARFVDNFITWYNHYIGHRTRKSIQGTGMVEYDGLKTTAKYGVTIVSSMLPALSILGLYFEKKTPQQDRDHVRNDLHICGGVGIWHIGEENRDFFCHSSVCCSRGRLHRNC